MDRAERPALERILAGFVPEGLVERLGEAWESGSRDTPGAAPTLAQRADVTVLFADLSGFTQLTERLDPEDVVALVDRFFSVVAAAAARHGGSVGRYLGDAAVVLFGAPRPLADGPARAVRAALDLQGGVKRLAREVAAERPEIDVRATCAIERGPLVAGVIGAADRLEYTVIGAAYDDAARLQKACEPGEVVVGPAAAAALGDDGADFALEALEPLAVRGGELRPFRVAPRRAGTAPEPGLAGRLDELEAIDERLARLAAGSGGALAITGPAGIGKSRLLSALVRRASARTLPAIELPPAGESPGAWLAVLFAAADHRPGAAALRRRDAGGLAAHAAEAVARLAGRTPFVVAVDDLPAVDEVSREALAAALPALAEAGGLLAAAVADDRAETEARERPHPAVAALAGAEVLRVGPLPAIDAKQLLQRLLPGSASDHPLLERLAREAAYVPRALERTAGTAGPAAAAARIEALPAGGAELLRVLAAAGALAPALGARAAGIDAGEATGLLLGAEAAGLVRAGPDGAFRLADPEVRRALLERLPDPERRRLHGRIAAALEAAGDPGAGLVHRLRGDDDALAVVAAAGLAEASVALGRPAAARALVQAGLDRARSAPEGRALGARLRRVEGRALRALGRPDEATSVLRQAVAEGDPADRAAAAVELVDLLRERGRLGLAAELLERVREGLGDGPEVAGLDLAAGELALAAGDPAAAEPAFLAGGARAAAAGDHVLEGRCRLGLARTALLAGSPAGCLSRLEGVEALLEDDDRLEVHLARADALATDGRLEEALAELVRARAGAGDRGLAGLSTAAAGILLALGRPADAEAEAGRALPVHDRLDDRIAAGHDRRLLGIAALAQGNLGDAELHLVRAARDLAAAGDRAGAAEALVALARLDPAAAAPRLEEARRHLAAAGATEREEAVRRLATRLASA